jgi:23S rRNA-/tRNA-specific pseudouridylate synthase
VPEPTVEVAFEDRHLLVVVKPAGIATTAPGGGPSLTRTIERQRPGALHPTSRLDAEVTGLVTYAKTKRAIETLRRARSEGRYGRGYLALASAAPEPSEGTWEASIAIDPRDPTLRIAVPPGAAGQRVQHAKTTYRVRGARTWQGGDAVALWLTPHTGRTHQLRVHAAHAGLPLLGDVRYGGPKRLVLPDGRVLSARRAMLHCAWLRIPRVEGAGEVELGRAAPDDLAELWEALGGPPDALAPTP